MLNYDPNYFGDQEYDRLDQYGNLVRAHGSGFGRDSGLSSVRKQLDDPESVYYSFLTKSDLSPAQRAFYKNELSNIWGDFSKNWTANNKPEALPYEDDFTGFLKGYNWNNNPRYQLAGGNQGNKYGFVPYSMRWIQ